MILGLSIVKAQKSAVFDKETFTFPSIDSLIITADLYSVGDKSKPIILLFHQSASSRGEYNTIGPELQKKGFNCLAVDLRWGKKDFWNDIPNETGKRYGSWEVIENFEQTETYQYQEVWPRMFDSYKDIQAALEYVIDQEYSGDLILWGSSFSAMFVFKAAMEYPDKVNGVIAYSPGEYYAKDTTLLTNWIKKVTQSVMINAGSSDAEFTMTLPLYESLPRHAEHLFHRVEKGRHGSSVLFADDKNWKPLLKYLKQFSKN